MRVPERMIPPSMAKAAERDVLRDSHAFRGAHVLGVRHPPRMHVHPAGTRSRRSLGLPSSELGSIPKEESADPADKLPSFVRLSLEKLRVHGTRSGESW